ILRQTRKLAHKILTSTSLIPPNIVPAIIWWLRCIAERTGSSIWILGEAYWIGPRRDAFAGTTRATRRIPLPWRLRRPLPPLAQATPQDRIHLLSTPATWW